MTKLDKLIGIPFKIGQENFDGCDCVGICWLYYKYIYNKDMPHRDGKRMLFRNPRADFKRIVSVIKTWASPVENFSDLRKNDIVILKTDKREICALGVLVNNFQVLCTRGKNIGSVLIKKKHLEDVFIRGYRANEAF